MHARTQRDREKRNAERHNARGTHSHTKRHTNTTDKGQTDAQAHSEASTHRERHNTHRTTEGQTHRETHNKRSKEEKNTTTNLCAMRELIDRDGQRVRAWAPQACEIIVNVTKNARIGERLVEIGKSYNCKRDRLYTIA